ncbi:MAG: hypothetical protein HKP58_18125 [Desulfatitalea sp.]|nr:PilZ domain-containing protein [Desulfatitalea sp.]NNK02334.1 hypothetical protein [Desulfatitalea sp.]
MKLSINAPEAHQFSVLQRLFDNRLSINSPDEFNDILAIYKDDPFLYRKYADLLLRLSRREEATISYATAANLFIEKGMNLQAIVAKMIQWSVDKPTHDEGRDFHARLHGEGSRQTPLQRFWSSMKYAEMVAFMRRLALVRLPAAQIIARVDAPVEDLFFIVFGALAEMPSPECQSEAQRAGKEIDPLLLGPNDVFGDIIPLQRSNTSDTEIRTLSDVELVKIAKPVLVDLSQKYPRIESLLIDLYKPENREMCERKWQTVRRAMRYGLPTEVSIEIAGNESLPQEMSLTGCAVDLSLTGMCVDLDRDVPKENDLKGQWISIKMELMHDVVLLNLTGRIVWQRQAEKSKTTIGVHFDTLNPMDREILSEYCSGHVGEQYLL